MKKEKRNELKMMNRTSLEALVLEERQKLLALRMQRAAGTLKNTAQMRDAKKTIARALTILAQQ